MRLHTALTFAEINELARKLPSDVELVSHDEHGSRSRARAFELTLRGYGERHTRWPNPGRSGGPDYQGGKAASYDDWGILLALIFEADPTAIAWPYKSREDFHTQTREKYAGVAR